MKKIVKHAVLSSMLLSILVLSIFYLVPNTSSMKTGANSASEIYEIKYVVGIFDERIAVFNSGSNKPIEVFNVYADELPTEDYEALKNGLIAQNEYELQKIIEDYVS